MSAFRKSKLSGLLWSIGIVVVLILCSVLIHPFGPVKSENSAEPLLESISKDARMQSIIGRSCQNCHSEKTEWPFTCLANAGDGHFDGPSYILSALPPGAGGVLVQNDIYLPLTATGIDIGISVGEIGISTNATFR